jgi:hypothetical protein
MDSCDGAPCTPPPVTKVSKLPFLSDGYVEAEQEGEEEQRGEERRERRGMMRLCEGSKA